MFSNPFLDYLIDASQRYVLFLDVMRERGNQYIEHDAKEVPNVLSYDYELIVDGRDLPKPVNYGLVRIPPAEDQPIDRQKRPFVVIDPRAGHGPGIGGFKSDSEIGVAMAAGHPCYFIGFSPRPIEGQTIEDVMRAEVAFIEHVISLHPEAEGKPAVIGNCQAGWAVMMLAAYRPDLCGPIILAGAPLTYWNGVRGKNPMRYSGGMLGGSWLTALTGDLGAGRFDGAWLVSNFEGMNPANTLWSKQYNVYSKIDTEKDRYLGFERWWGGHVILNAEEMQYIVDNLFVGNKLPNAEVETTDGVVIDYRNVRSPIICFCSEGDNITPPAQALGWILDLYRDVADIQASGQTIVYAVHPSIGHLGIFVSGGVAKKEHREFATNIDFIDCLPPGLYEAVLDPKSANDSSADLSPTDYIARFEARTLDDIRVHGANDVEDERRFETVARLSEINTNFYRKTMSPFVRAAISPMVANALMNTHPARVGFRALSNENPAMAWVETAAENVRKNRKPVSQDNVFWEIQEQMSRNIVSSLDAYRDTRDSMIEAWFMATFGNPVLQKAVGLDANTAARNGHATSDAVREENVQRKIELLKTRMEKGGVREAVIRSLLYIAMAGGTADERRFATLRNIRDEQDAKLSLADFKEIVREQFLMILVDEEHSINSIPEMLKTAPDDTGPALEAIRKVWSVSDMKGAAETARFDRISDIFSSAVTP